MRKRLMEKPEKNKSRREFIKKGATAIAYTSLTPLVSSIRGQNVTLGKKKEAFTAL